MLTLKIKFHVQVFSIIWICCFSFHFSTKCTQQWMLYVLVISWSMLWTVFPHCEQSINYLVIRLLPISFCMNCICIIHNNLNITDVSKIVWMWLKWTSLPQVWDIINATLGVFKSIFLFSLFYFFLHQVRFNRNAELAMLRY